MAAYCQARRSVACIIGIGALPEQRLCTPRCPPVHSSPSAPTGKEPRLHLKAAARTRYGHDAVLPRSGPLRPETLRIEFSGRTGGESRWGCQQVYPRDMTQERTTGMIKPPRAGAAHVIVISSQMWYGSVTMTLALSHKRDRLQAFERLCRERGLSLTIQRRTVLEAILEGKDHPTADEVHREVQSRLPGLSRTTVYRVLDTLVELGVINKVYQPGAPAIFDVGTHPHHHLACLSCNRVIDLEDELPGMGFLPSARRHGFEIRECHVFFKGMCRECGRKQAKTSEATGKTVGSRRRRSAKSKAKTQSEQGRTKRTRKRR